MAVENKGGSDLDVFEGLGKKAGPRASQVPPGGPPHSAPPRSIGNGPPPPPPGPPPQTMRGTGTDNGAKGTMLGMNSPLAAPPPPPGGPPAVPFGPPSQKSAPPPPPGRGALPSVAGPPSKSGSGQRPSVQPMFPPSSPPPASKAKPPSTTPNAAGAPGAKLDMDWDDEEEATHVFDKDKDDAGDTAPQPPPSKAVASAKPLAAPVKQTLLGITGPPPPPPSINPHAALPPPPQTLRPAGLVPPPPSSVGGAFARASSINSSSPGPVPYKPPPPPDLPPPSMPPQQVTAPMQMPQRSAPPPALPPPSAASSYRPPARDSAPHSLPLPLPLPMAVPNRMEATALVRPPEQNRGVLMAGIAAGAVMVIAVVFYLLPHTGQIAVNVADAKGAAIPHLQIFIDGKKQCESAPCIVSDVPTGSHTVKVEASGFEATVDKAVAVDSKKDVTVDFTLTPSVALSTGIKVTGTQPGAKLFVDDKEVGALPQELKDLSPGSHKVRVAAGDRFTALEKTVTIGKDEVQDLGAVTLKVVKGKATISLGTPGAKVFIVSGSDRRELPTLPISVDIDTTKQWALVASKAGFSDYNQPISFDDGQAEKAFTVSLEPKGAAPAWTPPPYTPPPAVVHTNPTPAPEKPEKPAAPEKPAPPRDTGGGGEAFLNINSIPASSVILDGKPIGQTPKLKYAVSPGSHSVLFVNADQGFKKQISVNVAAGETKPAIGKN